MPDYAMDIGTQRNGVQPICVVEEECGPVWQERCEYTLADFLELERGTALESGFEYWLGRNGEVGSPQEFRDTAPGPGTLLKAVLEVGNIDDPMAFHFREHVHDGFAGRPLKALAEWEEHYEHGSLEYLACRDRGKPTCHQIEQSLAGLYRFYRRIILPTPNGLYIMSRQVMANRDSADG